MNYTLTAPPQRLRFFSSLKGEWSDRRTCATHPEARQLLFTYSEMFSHRYRRHSTLGSISPILFDERYAREKFVLPYSTKR